MHPLLKKSWIILLFIIWGSYIGIPYSKLVEAFFTQFRCPFLLLRQALVFDRYYKKICNSNSFYMHGAGKVLNSASGITALNFFFKRLILRRHILGDPGADSGGEGKSKRAEKYGTKKSKQRREEPLVTMSYQTSSKRSPPFCLLIGQKNTKVFWHQSEVRTAATVWNWSGKTLSPGALLAVLYFSSCYIFPPVQTFPHPHYLPLGLRG